MYSIYERLLREQGIDSAEVSRQTGISQSTISNWKKRNNLISPENALILAKFFGVSLEYLMTGEEPHPADGVFYSKDEQELIGNYRILNDIGKASIKAYMTGIMQNPEMRRQKREESLPG